MKVQEQLCTEENRVLVSGFGCHLIVTFGFESRASQALRNAEAALCRRIWLSFASRGLGEVEGSSMVCEVEGSSAKTCSSILISSGR